MLSRLNALFAVFALTFPALLLAAPEANYLSKDPYEVLGLEKDAVPEEIQAAFRIHRDASHPDRIPDDPKASKKHQNVREAFNLLINPMTRAAHDRSKGNPGPRFAVDLKTYATRFRPAAEPDQYISTLKRFIEQNYFTIEMNEDSNLRVEFRKELNAMIARLQSQGSP